MTDHARGNAARALAQQLESWQAAGVSHVGKLKGRSTRPVAAAPTSNTTSSPLASAAVPPGTSSSPKPAPAVAPSAPTPPRATSAPPLLDKAAALQIVQKEVVVCTRCSHLARTRTQTVFGVGNPQARLCFVGEAPGADEDAQGIPFVGRAGQLLTKIIEACKLKREDVYILNVLKCRPPDNATPEDDEIANCRGYLDRQLEIIRPEYVCCLGAVAARTVLNSTASIGRLRGAFHDYHGIPVLCTYHPSYLLRNPAAKRDVWEDMKVLMRRMGIELG